MNNIISIVTDFSLELEAAHVLRGQGVDPERARADIVAVAQDTLVEARSLLEPYALYATFPVQDFHHQTVVLEGGSTFEGPLAARALAGATEIALAVCTIGPALEERVAALFAAGEPVRAMAWDGVGCAALRKVSEAIAARIRDEIKAQGLGSGMRAQPGQEGWDIWQQRILFDLLPVDRIGVRLTESCLMQPVKSVSFVIGLGPDMRPDAVACDFCSKRKLCPWRVQQTD